MESADEKWSLGDELLVSFQGIFYEATIIEMELNRDGGVDFTVHYKGWRKSYDEKISAEGAKRRFKKHPGEFHDDPTNNQYVVEEIREVKWSKRKNSLEFLVRWENYGEDHQCTWEPEANLRESDEVAKMLDEFLDEMAAKEKLIQSNSLGQNQPTHQKKAVKRSRPGPPPDTSTSVSLIQSPPKKYVKPLIEGEEAHFCIVPFLPMDGEAEGRLIENTACDAPDSSSDAVQGSQNGFGISIARPFLIESSKERLEKSTEVPGPTKEFLAMWNEFLLRERTTNLGQDFLYPALEKFVDQLRLKTENDDSGYALRSQLFHHLSTLVKIQAISIDERFALFARINPEKAEGLHFPDTNCTTTNVVRRGRKIGSKKGKKSIGVGMKKKNCSPLGASEQSPPVKIFPGLAESARRRNQLEPERGEENKEPCCSQNLNVN